LDEVKKNFLKMSLYELSAVLNKEAMLPSLSSYGDPNVYMRYKNNKWFESVNIIELKRQRAEE